MTTEELRQIVETFAIYWKETRGDKSIDSPFFDYLGRLEIAYHTSRLADAQERTNEWLGRIESAIRDTETKAWLMEIASQLTLISQKP